MFEIKGGKFVSLFFIIGTLFILPACNTNEAASSEVEQIFETPVAVTDVFNGSLSGDNKFTGVAIAGSDVAVMPKSAGEIVEIFVSRGEQVEKGQTLAKIASRDQQLALEADRAGLQQAQNAVERAKLGVTQATYNIEQAKSNFENAERQLETATLNHERMEALYNEGLISLRDYEEVENGLKAAQAQVEQAELNLKNAEAGVSNAEIAVRDAQVGVEQRQIAIDIAEKRVSETTIKAPITGQIASLDFIVGEMVSNQSPFARIIAVDNINVEVSVSANQLSMFEVGKKLNMSFAGLPNEQEGVVTFISPEADISGLFTVELQVKNPDGVIKPGMVATVNVQETLVAESLIIPTEAIIERQGVTTIYVINDNKAIEKEIEVVRYDTDFSAITGELSEGDKVVIKGQNLLSDGDLIRVVEEEK